MSYETDYYKEFEETHNMSNDLEGVGEMAKTTHYHTVHLREYGPYEANNTGGMTLCIHEMPHCFSVAKAICSKKDQFCRKTGRELAQHRMECGEIDIIYKNKKVRHLEHVIGMYRSLVDNGV